jgi:hypothetical protein
MFLVLDAIGGFCNTTVWNYFCCDDEYGYGLHGRTRDYSGRLVSFVKFSEQHDPYTPLSKTLAAVDFWKKMPIGGSWCSGDG